MSGSVIVLAVFSAVIMAFMMVASKLTLGRYFPGVFQAHSEMDPQVLKEESEARLKALREKNQGSDRTSPLPGRGANSPPDEARSQSLPAAVTPTSEGNGEGRKRLRTSPELVDAVRAGRLVETKRLIESGVSPDSRNEYEVPALHFAEAEPMIDLLLEAGADIELRDRRGRTSLIAAASNAQGDKVIYLLVKGASPKAMIPDDALEAQGWTAMHFAACMGGSQPILQALLDAGANINAGTIIGKTPLGHALDAGRSDVASYLVERGGNPSAASRV